MILFFYLVIMKLQPRKPYLNPESSHEEDLSLFHLLFLPQRVYGFLFNPCIKSIYVYPFIFFIFSLTDTFILLYFANSENIYHTWMVYLLPGSTQIAQIYFLGFICKSGVIVDWYLSMHCRLQYKSQMQQLKPDFKKRRLHQSFYIYYLLFIKHRLIMAQAQKYAAPSEYWIHYWWFVTPVC